MTLHAPTSLCARRWQRLLTWKPPARALAARPNGGAHARVRVGCQVIAHAPNGAAVFSTATRLQRDALCTGPREQHRAPNEAGHGAIGCARLPFLAKRLRGERGRARDWVTADICEPCAAGQCYCRCRAMVYGAERSYRQRWPSRSRRPPCAITSTATGARLAACPNGGAHARVRVGCAVSVHLT